MLGNYLIFVLVHSMCFTMNKFIELIDQAKDNPAILKIIGDALMANIDGKINTKQYHYIKGYADCKMKQHGKK